jgi:hypothetical protein
MLAVLAAWRAWQICRHAQANSCQALQSSTKRLLLFTRHESCCFVMSVVCVCMPAAVQNDGEDDEEPAATEGEEDEEGFVVGDGYLSDDEGMRDADEDGPAGARDFVIHAQVQASGNRVCSQHQYGCGRGRSQRQ